MAKVPSLRVTEIVEWLNERLNEWTIDWKRTWECMWANWIEETSDSESAILRSLKVCVTDQPINGRTDMTSYGWAKALVNFVKMNCHSRCTNARGSSFHQFLGEYIIAIAHATAATLRATSSLLPKSSLQNAGRSESTLDDRVLRNLWLRIWIV